MSVRTVALCMLLRVIVWASSVASEPFQAAAAFEVASVKQKAGGKT